MDDTLERMRAAVRAAAEDFTFREYEISNGLSPYELTRLIHIPNITHSTFVRYKLNISNKFESVICLLYTNAIQTVLLDLEKGLLLR